MLRTTPSGLRTVRPYTRPVSKLLILRVAGVGCRVGVGLTPIIRIARTRAHISERVEPYTNPTPYTFPPWHSAQNCLCLREHP